jgi:hypothetical protein
MDLLHMPAQDAVLLAGPRPAGIIAPSAAWTRQGNTLRWPASAGTSYVIGYRYHRRFRAKQGNAAASIHPAAVDSALALRFMRIDAAADGEMTLEFH